MPKKMELVGSRFGKLVVVAEHPDRYHGKVQWYCKCDCGNEIITNTGALSSGNTSGCGCNRGTHGHTGEKLYNVWAQMKYRCDSPSAPKYPSYGGRGISYCPTWSSYEQFYEDMAGSYVEGLSLDRRDNNGNYCKDNCRWVSAQIQQRNKRKRSGLSSQYRGVYYSRANGNFVARCWLMDGTRVHLGVFVNEVDAAMAVDEFIKANDLPNTLNFG